MYESVTIMVKPTKKINIKEYVSDNVIDLSMSNVTEVPAKEIVSYFEYNVLYFVIKCNIYISIFRLPSKDVLLWICLETRLLNCR